MSSTPGTPAPTSVARQLAEDGDDADDDQGLPSDEDELQGLKLLRSVFPGRVIRVLNTAPANPAAAADDAVNGDAVSDDQTPPDAGAGTDPEPDPDLGGPT